MEKRRTLKNSISIIILIFALIVMQITLLIPNDPGGISAVQPSRLIEHTYPYKHAYIMLLNNENQVKTFHINITKLNFIPFESLPIYKIQLPNSYNNQYLADNRKAVKQANIRNVSKYNPCFYYA